MANVSFEEISAADVATMLGVQKCTVSYWCRKGYMKFQDVSSAGSSRPRYQFTYDEVDRVSKLMEKYGKNAWCNHATEGLIGATKAEPVVEFSTVEPVIEMPKIIHVAKAEEDDVDELTGYIAKIRSLKKQREQLLAELDSIDNAIQTMREKVIAAI